MSSFIFFAGSFLWSDGGESGLISPSMSISSTSCVSFKYYKPDSGILTFYTLTPLNYTTMWSTSKTTESRWRTAQFKLNSTDDNIQLYIVSSNEVGLDDLLIVTGECSALGMSLLYLHVTNGCAGMSLCLPFERRETYCFSLIFSSASTSSASSQRSFSGP